MYAICRRDRKELDACGDRFGIKARYTSYEELLADPERRRGPHQLADRRPRAAVDCRAEGRASTSPARCRRRRRSTSAGRSSKSQRKSGKVYMMMETVVYSREYLFVKELYDKGELGRIQFLRGSHQQDMDGWPGYWEGFPPMHYATHCVSPCLAHSRQARRARRLPRLGPHRRGADPEVRQPVRDRDRDVQAARLGRLRRGDAQPVRHRAAVPRELRRLRLEEVVRVAAGRERGAGDPHQEHDGGAADRAGDPDSGSRCPDYAHLLPEPIQRFTQPAAIQDAEHLSFLQGGGHGGSHPHLVHNFLMACIGETAGDAGRGDVGELDDGGDLRAPVGAEGRREDRDSEVLDGSLPVSTDTRRSQRGTLVPRPACDGSAKG